MKTDFEYDKYVVMHKVYNDLTKDKMDPITYCTFSVVDGCVEITESPYLEPSAVMTLEELVPYLDYLLCTAAGTREEYYGISRACVVQSDHGELWAYMKKDNGLWNESTN